MREKVIGVKHINFGLIGPSSWESTEWTFFNDFKVLIEEEYNNKDEQPRLKEVEITEEEFKTIIDLFETASKEEDRVEGCDGDAWRIMRYENNEVIWQTNPRYTYGIESYETLQSHLFGILNK